METGNSSPGLHGFGVVLKGRARQNTFHLVADVEKNLVGRERNDRALKLFGRGAMRVRASKAESRSAKGFGRLVQGRLRSCLFELWSSTGKVEDSAWPRVSAR